MASVPDPSNTEAGSERMSGHLLTADRPRDTEIENY